MKKKMKRFEEGGDIYENNAPYKSDDQGVGPTPPKEFESAQGPNKNIGDDVRARAMAAMHRCQDTRNG
jgi:hypothetical protein